MTTQDIEKLKALCEKEGFELDFISRSTQGAMDIFRVEKKDKWDCDYIECIKDHKQGGLEKGMVLRALFLKNKPKREKVFASWDGFFEDHFKPSTKEDFDRYKEERERELTRAIITSFTLSNPYSTIVFTTSHRIKEGQVDAKEFLNHIEESIEAFLNRKR